MMYIVYTKDSSLSFVELRLRPRLILWLENHEKPKSKSLYQSWSCLGITKHEFVKKKSCIRQGCHLRVTWRDWKLFSPNNFVFKRQDKTRKQQWQVLQTSIRKNYKPPGLSLRSYFYINKKSVDKYIEWFWSNVGCKLQWDREYVFGKRARDTYKTKQFPNESSLKDYHYTDRTDGKKRLKNISEKGLVEN